MKDKIQPYLPSPRGEFGNKMPRKAAERIEAALVPTNKATDEARQLFHAGKFAEAEAKCQLALSLSPKINGKTWNTSAMHLLGQIYLSQGRNEEALQTLEETTHRAERSLSLDLALAYCRLGNITLARHLFSEEAITRYSTNSVGNLPGISSKGSLEASILLARGLMTYLTYGAEAALPDFLEAGKQGLSNALAAYYTARCFAGTKKHAEAEVHFRKAAQFGRGKLKEHAEQRLMGYEKPVVS